MNNNTTIVKNAEISRRILAGIKSGMTTQAAFDAVLGTGAHAKMAGELYDSFRK